MQIPIMFRWIRTVSTPEFDYIYSIGVDDSERVYAGGITSGDFGEESNKGNTDIFVISYTSDGVEQYAKMVGTNREDTLRSLAIHGTGEAVILGYTYGSLDGRSISLGDGFLGRYDTLGSNIWIKQNDFLSDENPAHVILRDEGIYVAGESRWAVNETKIDGGRTGYIAKYSINGEIEWKVIENSQQTNYYYALAGSADAGIYVAGYTYGHIEGEIAEGAWNVYIAKYDGMGTKIWTSLIYSSLPGDIRSQMYDADGIIVNTEYSKPLDIRSITTDADGTVYIAGNTYVGFDGEDINNSGDAFVSKITNDGTKAWTRIIGSTAPEYVSSLALDGNGGIYIAGSTGGELDGNSITGLSDGFVINYNKDGDKNWSTLIGSPGIDTHITSVSKTTGSSLFIAGYAYAYGDYDNFFGEELKGGADAFLMRYAINRGSGTPGAIAGNGAFQEGVTLTAPVVTGDPDGDAGNPNYSYQWLKGGTAITNATASTYAVPVTGAGTYKVAVTYTDAQDFRVTVDSPDQVVSKPTLQQVDIAPSQRGSRFRVENAAAPEVIVNLKGSPDLIEIDAEVSATLNAVTTENWGTGYVAWNVGSTIQAGTGERVSLNGLGKYSFVATAINAATSTIVLEQDKNSAFFLHDAYSAFYEGLTLSTDSTGRQSAARVLDFDVIKMGSAGGNSIVDLTSKDYITGAVTVHGADKGRSIFWGTDSDDTFLSGGGDSVIFGGGGFNQSILGAGKDVLQFRSTVDSTNLIQGFDPTKDVLELWRGRTETVEAPTFITDGNSTTMTWGNNTVQFEGLTGITAESLLISTRFAV